MSDSLTYILGAGASYQSIPIVATFNNRFRYFVDKMKNYSAILPLDTARFTFLQAVAYSETLLKEFEGHQSFDTFFKKLFHKEAFDDIRLYKKIINLYFIWEHVQNPENSITETYSDIFIKASRIDKRYDALIGSLLKPLRGRKEMFCKTNFITWNYDLHLLSAIKNYFFPDLTFEELFKEIDIAKPEWKITNQISILNMNGFFYSSVFDNMRSIDNHDGFALIRKKIVQNYFQPDYIDPDSERIKFAWEQENTGDVLSIAQSYINNSSNVVIIGYTFPLYNRLTDINYFKKDYATYGKKVMIQDPDSINLKENIISDFNLRSERSAIKEKIQCGNFYVPQDIFQM